MSLSETPPPGETPASAVATPRTVEAAVSTAAPSRAPRWFVWLGWAALAGYTIFLAMNVTAVAGGSDSSGYLNSARLFAQGELRTELRVPPEFATGNLNRKHFSPAGFSNLPVSEALAPSYPSGFPLHLALAGKLLGWQLGPFLVQLLAAVAAVWLCYVAARELGLDCALAGAGAAVLATFPVFIFTSIQTLSDTLATTWVIAAMICALRGRTSLGWAAACGAALSIAVLVRPTNLFIAPALVVLLGFDLRRVGWFFLGGVPGALWLGFYNHHLYGGAFRSGYGDILNAFAREYFRPTLVHFTKWLVLLLPAAVLVLPFAALTRRETRRRELLGLGLMFGAITGVYLFCSFSHEVWTYLRYILPALPPLILAALLGLEALARGPGARWPRAFRPAVALALTLWAVGNSWHWTRGLSVFLVPVYERCYEQAAQLVRTHAPANALVVCGISSGAIYYYTPLPALLYDSVEPAEFARYLTLARNAGRPIYAVLFATEEEDSIHRRCPGAWTRIASAGNIGIWRLD